MTLAAMDTLAQGLAKQIAGVPKLWPGSTIVILGGGPSLTVADVNYCQHRAKVIAIKEAYLLAPWADVLYAADNYWWKHYNGAPDFKGLKYTTTERPPVPMLTWPDVQVLENTGDEGLELAPTGLRTGHNSGYQAINVAVHLGAARILLLGFDMWSGPDGQNWHHAKRFRRTSNYAAYLQMFSTIGAPLKDANVTVLNCSRRTFLNAFPRVSLEEALP